MVLLVFTALILPVQAALAQDWPQFQKDVTHTGHTTEMGPVTANTVKYWKAALVTGRFNGINTTPVVADNKVFCISAGGNVYAYTLNGASLWHVTVSTATGFELSVPAYGDGKLFVATNEGGLFALNASTGATMWGSDTGPISSVQINTPVVYDSSDGRIYFGDWYGTPSKETHYYCYDASTGDAVWSRASARGKGYYWSGACVIGDCLVYGGDDGYLTCVNKSTGEFVSEFQLTTRNIRASVTWDPEALCLYTSDNGGYLHALSFDPSSGTFGSRPWEAVLLNGGVQSTSTPVVYGGRIYVGTGGVGTAGGMHCRNQSDGADIWDYVPVNSDSSKNAIQSSPAVSVSGDDVYVYFTTNSRYGQVYCLHDDGDLAGLVWSYNPDEYGHSTHGYILQGVAVYGGRVFFGNDGAYLYALGTPPVADDQSVTTDENTALPITLTAADAQGNPLTYTVVTQPANGALTGTAPDLTYTPNSGYHGADSFTFQVNDGVLDSNIATVSITVVQTTTINLRATGIGGDIFNVDDYPVPDIQVTEDNCTMDAQTAMGAVVYYCQQNGIEVTVQDHPDMGLYVHQIGTNVNDEDCWTYTVDETTAWISGANYALTGRESVHWANYNVGLYSLHLSLDKTSIKPGDDVTGTVTYTDGEGQTVPVNDADVYVSSSVDSYGYPAVPGVSVGQTNASGQSSFTWNDEGAFYPYAEWNGKDTVFQWPVVSFTCVAATPAWDVNGDGSINVLDLSRVGDRFGETGAPGWIPEDVNRDGVINVLDLSLIGDHFGE